ncbi:unnamed protein product, partial [Adineta steineri]
MSDKRVMDSNSIDDNSDDNDEISEDPECDISSKNTRCSATNTKEISVALALFRHRHKLSKSYINDLCNLLRYFGIPNIPVDFRSIEKNLMENHENTLQAKSYTVCSTCNTKGVDLFKCENIK